MRYFYVDCSFFRILYFSALQFICTDLFSFVVDGRTRQYIDMQLMFSSCTIVLIK